MRRARRPVHGRAPPLSMVEAAGFPNPVYRVENVFERGLCAPGELLVHGGTSGIGTIAIMLGRLFGLT